MMPILRALPLLSVALTPVASHAEMRLADLLGTWSGAGTYAQGSQSGRVRCRVAIAPLEVGITLDGRCAAAAGAQEIAVDILPDQAGGSGYVTQADGAAHLAGGIAGNRLLLTGAVEASEVTMELILTAPDALRLGLQRGANDRSVIEMTRAP